MSKKIGILGVPQDLGQSRRGVDMGASAIRVAGIHDILKNLGCEVYDYGNISCHDISEHLKSNEKNHQLHFLEHIVNTSELTKVKVEQILADGCFPLILGGDHSINIGTMAGMKAKHHGKTGIMWIDAHGDFNNADTSPSGNIHGMPFAIATGRGNSALTRIGPSPTVNESNAILIGAREIDGAEAKLLKDSQVTVFTMRDIDEQGFAYIAKKALEIATKGVDHLHVSLDIDVIDPSEAPGTGTSSPGGLTYREAHLLMELIASSNKLSSMEVVEVNPTLDTRNKTAKLAVGLIASALGKTIL